MRIASVEVFVLKLQHRENYLGALQGGASVPAGYHVREPWRSLYSPLFETVLVKITADDGTAGWGEGLAPVGPEILAMIIRRLIAPQLIGMSAVAPRPAWNRTTSLMRERGHLVGHQADALAAIDIALWDLAARLHDVPLVELLGGAFREEVPVYVSGLPRSTDADRALLAREWQDAGMRSVKLHLGLGVDHDLATVAAVHEAAPQLRIAVDAHWAYSPHDGLRLAEGLSALGGWFLEAPLVPEDEQAHRELVRRSPIPIAVGETLRNRFEFERWTAQRALDLAQPDVGRTGLTEALSIAEVCSARHLPTAPHHSVGLGVLLAAGIHFSAAIPDLLAFEYQPTSTEIGQSILTTSLLPDGASFRIPNGPGLGIDIDEPHIRQLAKEHS
ncbi:mandelate racemase/muconate lactonizing enzyme family protein [Pseudoclavibacter sp. RFBJ3]|uniref:mandelate racemase/muconate lactonizing enzyme family protein n=1 Tax=unclassified Pseudoclavibacter TaxID=2615177 RepID=UPI000CE90ABA|nr:MULTISPECIES: mandelate racemase/muconate lactonizing enzyme family protein [unclassified Pseudoclavibacter]PPF84234.1 mandelate racemase/muconate lactonizing enzyme family protein [Pseudoclavibacter sp. RFBJ5]PPF92865.1 mandelate racemase/muconate lactonizing enzyme family protein [Pseudoclavibacter sp. RFBJ3]PPF98062.1 mandelate racemase/muconate lactonizing enzyme family protein [Pseudoclavibacter sp. RFBH5]PPG25132.1 mandelate racemase/muconate lactonizing enzyme family protein [Pseudocl